MVNHCCVEPDPVDEDALTLAKNSILARLGDDVRRELVSNFVQVAVTPGTMVLREGDRDGQYAFFILEGTARVQRRGLELQSLGPSDHFGELALVGDNPRPASVRAVTALRLARFSRSSYRSLVREHPHTALHLSQALAGAVGDALAAMTDNLELLMRQRALPRRTRVWVQREATPDTTVASTVALAPGTPISAVLPGDVDGARVVAGMLNGRPVSLGTQIVSDARVGPITLGSWEGRDIYRRSVALLLLAAAYRIEPALRLHIAESIGTARVVLVDAPSPTLAARLEQAMIQLAKEGCAFRQEHWTVEEARVHFAERGWDDAVALLRAHRESTVTLTSGGEVLAACAEPVLPDASSISDFRLLPHPRGFLLDFGGALSKHLESIPSDAAIAQEQSTPRFDGEMSRAHRAWLAPLGVTSVGALNDVCVSGQVRELIRVSEGFHEKRIGRIADSIASRKGALRVIAIAGPSSSGKTTFIKRLTVQLEINGIKPVNLSLDDYYVDRLKTPRDRSGGYDFEAIEAIDLPLLRDHVRALLAGRTQTGARYDFKSGLSSPRGGPDLTLGAGDVLLVEGIHGLDPALFGDAVARAQLFNLFVHPSTTLPLDRLSVIAPADVRLVRRIVRDRHTRGYSAAENIKRWASVRAGEERHIFPLLPHADAVFDTSLAYELGVLKVFADRYLLEVPPGDPAAATAHRLRSLLDRFVTIYPDHVPPTSIIREFIGGSGFEY